MLRAYRERKRKGSGLEILVSHEDTTVSRAVSDAEDET